MDVKSLKIHFSQIERGEILKEIDEILNNGKLSQGDKVREFEEELVRYTGIENAIAVNSGSSAIEMVMRILGVKDKTVLIPTNTFLATASGVIFAGGKVKLLDTDPATFSVSLEEIKKKYTKDTAGVILVHIGGIITPELEAITKWCEEQNIWLFEDAAHAHGSTLNGKQAGSFGIAASYSLFATKVITCGEGGYILTNNNELADKIRLYRNHGKKENWVTLHSSMGNNCRMSEIHAVIAKSQLKELNNIINERNQIASFYMNYFTAHLPEVKIIKPLEGTTNWYKYIVLLPEQVDREKLKRQLKEKGIYLPGEVYITPLHKQPIAKELGWMKEQLPYAETVCAKHVCLPIYKELEKQEMEYVAKTFAEAVKKQM